MLTGIHHLTFVVRDLDASIARWQALLGPPQALEVLSGRQVRTARFAAGSTWVVLVQPLGDTGEVARVLAERGEGLLLVSLGVDDLAAASAAVVARDIALSGPRRTGLLGWQLQDLAREPFDGIQLQLCQDPP
jgi:methylmalonyl-CoA/ethylmalonyl-CoA epimerase